MTQPQRISRRALPISLFAAGATAMAATREVASPTILLVVAHPDDEYYFAATVYRLAQELGATVDQVVITNGEAGYRYSTLAEKVYGAKLTNERTGRAKLPQIRRRETLAAGKILGIRDHHFLGQCDARFTLDATEADEFWDCARIRRTLAALLTRHEYDFVFTLLPRESTHGHHQAATVLTLEAVESLPSARRPVVLAAEPGQSSELVPYTWLSGAPITQSLSAEPALVFERTRSFGYEHALRYDIVVNWVISEHKSQGMFQNDWGRHDVERFWLLALGPTDAVARTRQLSQLLSDNVQESAA